jgi:hypothetical protein
MVADNWALEFPLICHDSLAQVPLVEGPDQIVLDQ